jgi:hypothetical protein
VTVAALTVLSLTWWGLRLVLRHVQPPRTMPVTTPLRPAGRQTSPLGLEDDPDRWHVTRSAWTALDELQLTRLLEQTVPLPRPPASAIDDAVPQCTQKDTT